MLPNTSLAYILAPAILIWLVLSFAVRTRYQKQADPVRRSWNEFRVSISVVGVLLMVLWFALPSTPSLSTFGYPAEVEAVSQPGRLLTLLQEYNRALVRTTEVVYWVIFILVWWLLSSLHSIAKALNMMAHRHETTQQ